MSEAHRGLRTRLVEQRAATAGTGEAVWRVLFGAAGAFCLITLSVVCLLPFRSRLDPGTVALIMLIPPLAQSVLTLVGMFGVLLLLNWQLALLALTVVPFLYCSVGFYMKHIHKRLSEVRGMEGESLSIIHEAISMLRVIVAFVVAMAVVVIAVVVIVVVVGVAVLVVRVSVAVRVFVFGEEVRVDFQLRIQVEAAQVEDFLDVRFAEIDDLDRRPRVHVQQTVA